MDLNSIEDDYNCSLKEVYESLSNDTRELLNREITKIWLYFICWFLFIAFSLLLTYFLVTSSLIYGPIENKVQRVGSVIPLLAILGEALFLFNLNKLVSVIHPAQLTYQIYKKRRFKFLRDFSLVVTTLLVVIGGVLSGYGDLIYCYGLDILNLESNTTINLSSDDQSNENTHYH